MTLHSPIFLWGLALILPLIAVFLFRRRRTPVRVPSSLLWQKVAVRRSRNRKFRNLTRLLSFLLCMLAFQALVFSAAQPAAVGDTSLTIVVFDVSASMGSGDDSAFEEAKELLAERLNARGPRERFAIVSAGEQPQVVCGPTSDGPTLSRSLESLTPTNERADLVAALQIGEAFGTDGDAILVFHDGGAASVDDNFENTKRLIEHRVGASRHNVGIATFALRPPADAVSDDELEALVSVIANGDAPREVELTLFAGELPLETHALTLTPGEVYDLERRMHALADELSVEVRPLDEHEDAIAEDNRAAIAIEAHTPPTVALLSADDDDDRRYFVEQALRASGVRTIVDQVTDETTLVVAIGQAPEGRQDRPVLYVGTLEGEHPGDVALLVDPDALNLRSVEPNHALTRGVSLDGVTMERASAIAVPDGARALIELDGGTVLATGGTSRARWVFMGLDPAHSDLVLRVAFPVLMANALQVLGGSADIKTATTLPMEEIALTPATMFEARPAGRPAIPLPASVPLVFAVFGALLLAVEGGAWWKGWLS